MNKKLAMLVLGVLATVPGQAFAYDWVVTAKVNGIEISYAPNTVDFTIDQVAGSCAANTLLWWNAQGTDTASKIASYQAALSVLITARSTGQHVAVFGNNNGCLVTNMYLVP